MDCLVFCEVAQKESSMECAAVLPDDFALFVRLVVDCCADVFYAGF